MARWASTARLTETQRQALENDLALVREVAGSTGVAIFVGPPSSTCACSLEERRQGKRQAASPLDRRYAYREEECPLRRSGLLQLVAQHPSSSSVKPPVVCVSWGENQTRLCIQCALPDFPQWPPSKRGLAIRTMTYALLRAFSFLRSPPTPMPLLTQGEWARVLIRSLLEAQRADQESLAMEIHDGLAQTLVGASQILQAVRQESRDSSRARAVADKAIPLVRRALQEARSLMGSLQTPSLPTVSLVDTLRRELYELASETGWPIDFHASPVTLSLPVASALYRIATEAIANARRHSRTQRLRVSIEQFEDRVQLQVQDWGVGFDPHQERPGTPAGYGLRTMRKRAELLGGATIIRSSPGAGTLVEVTVPLRSGQT